jgi:hypothetical protein
MSGEPEAAASCGLTGLRAEPPERVPIRVRSSGTAQSAWRMGIACDQGAGAIVLAEVGPAERHYRGEGLFLGWTHEKMAALYQSLLPQADEPVGGPQLG